MCYGMHCEHENAMGECTCRGHYDCPDPITDYLDDFLDNLDILDTLGQLDERKLIELLGDNEDLFLHIFTYEIDKQAGELKVFKHGELYKTVSFGG